VTKQAISEHFRGLSTDAKLDLLYELWGEVTAELEQRPATEAERRFLEDRLRDIEADPRSARPWDDVRAELLADR